MYLESYDNVAYLAMLDNSFCQRHLGSVLVSNRDKQWVATRSSSELPHDNVHGVSSGFGKGISKVASSAHL